MKYKNLTKQAITALPDHELMLDRENYLTWLELHKDETKTRADIHNELKIISHEIIANRPGMNAEDFFK